MFSLRCTPLFAAFVTGQDIVVGGGYIISPLYTAQPQAAATAFAPKS